MNRNKYYNRMNILGVDVSCITKKELDILTKSYLKGNEPHFITTPNAEIILRAIRDEEYFFILNQATLAIPDSFSLKLASLILYKKIERITGADYTLKLLKLAKDDGSNVLIIIRNDSLSNQESIKNSLKEKFPGLNFDIATYDISKGELITKVENFKPDIVFAALGAPYQEKFIYHNLSKWPGLKIAIGVGGAFDFITGAIKRAPRIFRKVGMEWLWRLAQEPRFRYKRILNALIVFPYHLLIWRYVQPLLYRKNIACLLYKKENNRIYILMVERTESPGHWQIPQGGTDGLSTEEAGVKELSEELHTDQFVVKKTFENQHYYEFGKKKAIHRGAIYKYGYKGQKQSLMIAEYQGSGEEINVNYWDHSSWKWVPIENFLKTAHFMRQESYIKYVKLFNNFLKENI